MTGSQSGTGKRIARVFPRRTRATPDDGLSFFGLPPLLDLPEIDEVHVSVAFTYDIPRAEALAYQWEQAGVPVRVGGPAYGDPGGEFIPGLYLRKGYTITSRGCNNHCWFCMAARREGPLRELEIKEGWDILDNNLLQCSPEHIRAVFAMLERQAKCPLFTGGLEARLLRPWHVDLLRSVRATRMYFAYDTPEDYEPLVAAGRLLRQGGISAASHRAACYVLIGYPGDTMEAAKGRLTDTWRAGFLPYAMLYRDDTGNTDGAWRKFQTSWIRPVSIVAQMRAAGIKLAGVDGEGAVYA